MARILNNILCTLMIFILTFAWATYCLKDGKLALFVAATVALCGCYIIFEVPNKVQNKNDKLQKNRKKIKNFSTFLRFNADNEAMFAPMFEFFGYAVTRVDFDSAVLVREKQSFAAFCFGSKNITTTEVQKAVVAAKRHNCNRLLIFCGGADKGLQQEAQTQLSVKFVDLENTFALFEQAGKLPQLPQNKPTQNHILPQYVFNKKRFGWYFSAAVFTLLTAAVSFLKVYLLVWSTALFALAMYSLFNKKFNNLPTDVKLE